MTLERVRSHPVILAVQDTTTLNYTAHPPQGVGPINTTQDRAVGLVLHDTMAFTPEGTPLGLLNVQCWARDPAQAGKRHRRHQLPIEEKESRKWLVSYRSVAQVQKLCPHTRLISVGDREADLYELFQEAAQEAPGPGLLVRAERSRQRQVEHEDEAAGLWARMAAETMAGTLSVAVPRRGSRPACSAKLECVWPRWCSGPRQEVNIPPCASGRCTRGKWTTRRGERTDRLDAADDGQD